MRRVLTTALLCLGAGGLASLGAQAAKHFIPDPATRIVVCSANDIEDSPTCKGLDEVLNASAARAKEASP